MHGSRELTREPCGAWRLLCCEPGMGTTELGSALGQAQEEQASTSLGVFSQGSLGPFVRASSPLGDAGPGINGAVEGFSWEFARDQKEGREKNGRSNGKAANRAGSEARPLRSVRRHRLGRPPATARPTGSPENSFLGRALPAALNGPLRRWPPPPRPGPPGTPEPGVALPRGWGAALTHWAAGDSPRRACRPARRLPRPSRDCTAPRGAQVSGPPVPVRPQPRPLRPEPRRGGGGRAQTRGQQRPWRRVALYRVPVTWRRPSDPTARDGTPQPRGRAPPPGRGPGFVFAEPPCSGGRAKPASQPCGSGAAASQRSTFFRSSRECPPRPGAVRSAPTGGPRGSCAAS